MTQKSQAITVIIPTTAAPERHRFIRRAVESVLDQNGVEADVLLVANGARRDEAFLKSLEGTPRLTIMRRAEGSLPLALKAGREAITTPFFSELDDDDIILPDGLRRLLDSLVENPKADWAVGNTIVRCPKGRDNNSLHDLAAIRADPLQALMRSNWLLPGSALFRTARVPASIFADMPKYLEWTYLGVALCLRGAPVFLPEPVTVHHVGLSHSIDLSREATFGRVAAFKQLIAMPLPSPVTRHFKGRLGALHHSCSMEHLRDGDVRQAWVCHLRSLLHPGGWAYLSFTRYLLRGALPAASLSS